MALAWRHQICSGQELQLLLQTQNYGIPRFRCISRTIKSMCIAGYCLEPKFTMRKNSHKHCSNIFHGCQIRSNSFRNEQKNKDFPSFWYEFSQKLLLIDHLYRARIRQPRKVMENLEYPDKALGLKRSFLRSMVTLMELRHPKNSFGVG